jgi:hypothetical protein
MTDPQHDASDGGETEGASRRGALVAIVVIVAVLAGGWWLSRALHETGRIQDCVMAGRTNCAPIAQ